MERQIETLTCCSTYLCTHNLGISGRHSNQPSCLARAGLFTFMGQGYGLALAEIRGLHPSLEAGHTHTGGRTESRTKERPQATMGGHSQANSMRAREEPAATCGYYYPLGHSFWRACHLACGAAQCPVPRAGHGQAVCLTTFPAVEREVQVERPGQEGL